MRAIPHSISPRAVAVMGIGFVPRLVAVQGLWAKIVVVGPSNGHSGGPSAAINLRQDEDGDVWICAVQFLGMTGEETQSNKNEKPLKIKLSSFKFEEGVDMTALIDVVGDEVTVIEQDGNFAIDWDSL